MNGPFIDNETHTPKRTRNPIAATMPAPLFIVTCMRSFSSVVCGMLGQHPDLYGLPEINLATGERMGNLMRTILSIRPMSLHGLFRTIAELEFGEQTDETIQQARAWLKARAEWTTAEMFHHIASRAAPRALVEKSPTSAAEMDHLLRLLHMFPDAHFLHLTRHPRPTCKSIHKLVSDTDRKKGTDRAERMDPEQAWVRLNMNAFEFLAELPPGQGMQIRGEDLLSEPEIYLPQICEWLGIRSDAEAYEAMMHPERSAFACFGPPLARFGNDPGFLTNPGFRKREIPSASLDGPLEWANGSEAVFSQKTRILAACLGYQ